MEVWELKYLKLSADFLALSLVDQQDGPTSPSELGLSTELQNMLTDWNSDYQTIIPLSMSVRSSEQWNSIICSLDTRGLNLAQMIADEQVDDAKVEYYSEGLLKRIDH
ncbi:hypothetical protein JOJ86_000865 [Rhodococcus percolatus]|uniref:hypothetical protein n=1 Tax=Rhodococcus opacus TaxID=37919 RepID=UPI0015FC1825|nr:hypothetical protein [Rhodococcus opacus]MBA8960995.1 hypothetical protein [Rhodococcus opacus]MBP2203139.1 hypothetical protein [Rhodococcus opacus]